MVALAPAKPEKLVARTKPLPPVALEVVDTAVSDPTAVW
jgi:hypothetical protein